MGENSIEKYREDARDVLTAHDPRIRIRPDVRIEAFGVGDFEDAIARLVQSYVGQELEWAAQQVERIVLEFQRVANVDPAVVYVLAACSDIANTIRRRGQP